MHDGETLTAKVRFLFAPEGDRLHPVFRRFSYVWGVSASGEDTSA